MDIEELRLRCIEAAAQRTPDFKDAMSRAKAFYDFVMEEQPERSQADTKKLVPAKKADNAKILP